MTPEDTIIFPKMKKIKIHKYSTTDLDCVYFWALLRISDVKYINKYYNLLFIQIPAHFTLWRNIIFFR